jgi:hypothetical protein
MKIRITCPNPKCRKPLRIDARNAGKKVACKECDQHIRLPTAEELKLPVAALSTGAGADGVEPEIEFDLLATEAVLGEKAAAEAAAKEVLIDFTCPMCDEPVQLPAEHSGKRAPCPSCRRIIQVPKVDVGQPKDWREKAAQLPSLAKKDDDKLEGAWGNKDMARVSLEALEEAKALPKERRQLTTQDWVRYGVYAVMALACAAVIWWGYGKYRLSSTESSAIAGIEPPLSDPSTPPDLRAWLLRVKGEWLIQFGTGDDASREGLTLLREATSATSDPLWQWALAREVAGLYGRLVTLDPKATTQLVDVQTLVRLIYQVHAGEPREEVVRALCRAVLEQAKGDPEKLDAARNLLATVIRTAVPPTRLEAPPQKTAQPLTEDLSEQLSCLGILAQELLRIEARDKALDVVGRVKEAGGRLLYQTGMHVPKHLVAAMTALALQDLDVDPAWTVDFELAKMIGFGLANQPGPGEQLMKKRVTEGFAESNLLPFLDVAELALDAGRKQDALNALTEAMKIAEIYTDARERNWKHRVYGHLRLVELTARSGDVALAEQRLQKLRLNTDPSAGPLAAGLITMHKPIESDATTLLTSVPDKSAAQALAAFHLARKQAQALSTLSPPAIANLPEGGVQAAGRLGALMGYKSLRR